MRYYVKLLSTFIVSTYVFSCEFYPPFEEINVPNLNIPYIDSSLVFYMSEDSNGVWLDQSIYKKVVELSIDLNHLGQVHDNNTRFLEGNCNGYIKIRDLEQNISNEMTVNFWMRSLSGKFAKILTFGDRVELKRSNAVLIDRNLLDVGNMPDSGPNGVDISLRGIDGFWNMLTIVISDSDDGETEYEVFLNGMSQGRPIQTEFNFHGQENDIVLFDDLNGSVDNLSIYNRSLDGMEIDSIFQSESKDFTMHEGAMLNLGLEYYLTFDGRPSIDIRSYYDIDYEREVEANFSYSQDTPSGSGFSAKLDGLDDYIGIPISQLSEYGAFSISFWCKVDSLQDYHPILSFGSKRNSEVYFDFRQIYAGSKVEDFDFDTKTRLAGEGWNMITITCSKINQSSKSADIHLYVNGGTTFESSRDSSDIDFFKVPTLFIGRNFEGSAYYNGRIDNLRIYNRMLTSAEVMQIFDEEKP